MEHVAGSVGSGGFLRQIGLFETANGLPHGSSAMAVAIVLALVVYPVSRLIRFVARRWPSAVQAALARYSWHGS